jgi:gliding motility-associated-like protein
VVLTGLNACGADTDTLELSFIDCDTVLCGIQMPNTFTPNGDGANDEFGFVSDCEEPEFELYEFSVYNRWGNLVFEADEPGEAWDGTDDGEPAPSEVYYYYFNYQVREQEAPAVLQGDVSLLR